MQESDSLFLSTRSTLAFVAIPETLDDLLRPVLEGDRFTAWCESAGLTPYTVLRLRQGKGKPHAGTVLALATKLRVPRARVARAINASRAANAAKAS